VTHERLSPDLEGACEGAVVGHELSIRMEVVALVGIGVKEAVRC